MFFLWFVISVVSKLKMSADMFRISFKHARTSADTRLGIHTQRLLYTQNLIALQWY